MKYYLLAVVLSASCAYGQERERIAPKAFFYGDIGPAFTEDMDVRFPTSFGLGPGTIDLDPGMRFSVGGGAEFGDFFALHVETGWILNEIDSMTGFDDVDGYVSQVPFLVNATFQFRNNTGLVPFIGGGAGGSASGINLDDADAATVELDGSAGDVVFAWQAFGGLEYELNDNLSVGLVYKYFWSDDGEWEVDDDSEDIRFGGARSHSISAVVNYRF